MTSVWAHLRRRPGFAFGAALSLALGMSLATVVFSMIDALFLRALPFVAPDRLVVVGTIAPGASARPAGIMPTVTPREIVSAMGRSTSFEALAGATSQAHIIGPTGQAHIIEGVAVSSAFFDVLRIQPAMGRLFQRADGASATGDIVVSHAFWESQLGSDSNVVGRTIAVDGGLRRVIGVVPRGLEYPRDVPLWTLVPDDTLRAQAAQSRGWYTTIGRLKPGITRERAAAELTTVFAASERDAGVKTPSRAWLAPLSTLEEEAHAESIELWIAAALLVIILCAVNFATMILARGMSRRSELAVRSALGASFGRLLGLLVSEAAVIAAFGGALAVVLAMWTLRLVNAAFTSNVLDVSPSIDWRAAGFALLGTTVVGSVFACMPGVELSRADLRSMLSGGSAGATSSVRDLRGRRGLVALQIGLALTCVIVVVSVVRGDLRDYSSGPGYAYQNVVTGRMTLADSAAPWSAAGLTAAVRSGGGVADAAIVRTHEVAGFNPEGNAPRELFPHLYWSDVTPNYFSTIGIRLISGRLPTPEEAAAGAPVLVVSARNVPVLWCSTCTKSVRPDSMSVLGQRFRMRLPDGRRETYTVIGVVDDIRTASRFLRRSAPIYTVNAITTLRQDAQLVVRVRGDRRKAVDQVRAALQNYGGHVMVSDVRAAYDDVALWRGQMRGRLSFLACVAALALVLAGIGVFGLTAHTTALRLREIGIRKALGASDQRIIGVVVGDLGWMAALGCVFGLLVSGRIVAMLDAVLQNPFARMTIVRFPVVPALVAAGTLLVIAGVGVLLPARRALRMDVARVVTSV